ncbi:MAG: hypothetical protein AW09_002429 [Candidatus Accumulibacter phosphatis]|uniref:Uncharacterized protein n=1 Tax=Candidatus Accumulibacter phosphatis TaxID=327160 RepID=A0A080LUX8_9PROT|nr:MAG: hypothetical protein AW09_002429 [Candidatus Accumulibacter phosphatis]
MDLDHLQRQAGSQVGTGPLHDSEQAGQVVHDFAATAIAFVIDGRKVIFQVDSGADRASRQQGRFEYVPIGIRQRIVGNQEHPSIEKRPAAHRAAADESRRNGGMPEFGPRLADVLAPVCQMCLRLLWRGVERRRCETTAALDGMVTRRFLTVTAQCGKSLTMTGWQLLEVVPDVALVTGVVLGADEVRRLRDDDSLPREAEAQRRPVGHRRKHARIRSAVAAGTGTAIVSGEMRVVAAVRTVADDQYQRREMLRQTNAAQESADAGQLLLFAEAESWRVAAGGPLRFAGLGGQFQCAWQRLVEAVASALKQ